MKELRQLGKISESDTGFEPTTLHDLARPSNHWDTGDSDSEQKWNVGLIKYKLIRV